jgi:NADPH:quinone reductase-like Zn-dependent oxidoreductase
VKAIVYRRYGGPEVLQFADVEVPRPGPRQVLVKVRASSLNAADWRMMRADPFLVRLMNGLLRPKKRFVLGQDVAGVVVAVGQGAQRFAIGDEVFGETPMEANGAFAEYAVVDELALARKPARLRFDEAAATPLAGTTALQALRLAGVGPGKRVLIQGAGGGVGLFTAQLARLLGAHVTAVAGPRTVELLATLGAHRVHDYTRHDFAASGETWDAIVGVNGYRTLRDYRRALAPGGRYVMVGGSTAQLFEALLFARPYFALDGKRAGALTIDHSRQADDLAQLATWLERGELRAVIDSLFDLEQAAAAMELMEQGHARGKVVLRVA